ncbi:hypothetical protein HYDPIDRAFT_104474 [Hydnomerulius pinastri MD-312]|nr:hypothetical protein HYDPIDRAFT_104474 [Hydnomerulius pinastri MD-312]
MPAYRGTSLEELRLQDYQQNRKTANAFGQPAFGAAPAPQPASGLFGTAATTQQPATGSIFGGGTTNAFGANTATTQPGTSAFGTFSQPQQQQQQNQPAGGTGGSIFGGGSAFGQPQQQQQQPQQQPSGFGTFGQTQQQQPAAGTGSIFGGGNAFAQQNKPATGFGGSTYGQNTGSAFGGTGTTNAFGQPANQPATGTTSIFGQSQQQQNQGTSAFSALGTNNAAKPSIFGTQPAQPAAGTGTGFGGLFGNPQNPQQGQQTQPTTSLFGNNTSTGSSLFGGQQQNQQQQQPQQQTGGLFGNPTQPSGGLFGNATGSSLFGNTQQNQTQQPAQTTSLFGGAKPAAPGTSLFGGTFGQAGTNTTGTGAQQTSLFGQPLGQQQTTQPATGTSAFGGSLFGQQKPVAPALNTSTSTGGLGGSLFGNNNMLNVSTSAPGVQGSFTASIAEPIASNLPIFSMLPPGPRAVPVDQQQQKKKPGFLVPEGPPRFVVSYAPASSKLANTKLRGFGASSSSSILSPGGQNGNPLAMSLANSKAGSMSMSRVDGGDFLGRSSSPALGSGGRQSVKKLILDKKVEPSDLFSRSGSPGMRGSPGKVTFSPALSQAAREKEVAREKEAAPQPPPAPPTESPAPANRKAPGRFTAQSTLNLGQSSSPNKNVNGAESSSAPAPLQHGDYWVKPDLSTLKTYGYEDLLAFKGLVVGRVGYGEIHFLEPVDLTGLPKLGALLGELVRFDDKECSVYPDGDDADKPPPGSGLNVRARITLVRCWAVDKATREPVKDEKEPAAIKHLKRLKGMKDTQFESFDAKEGKWTFTVDHF